MRHEFTRRCLTLGSALAMGWLTLSTTVLAEQPGTEPKQRALISFKMDFLSRFKNDEPAVDPPAAAKSEVVAASAVEPLPAGAAKTHAVPATNARPAEPLPPTSLATGGNAAAAQPLSAAAAEGQFPSVLPPSVPPVQLTSGQFPLPPAGQMPFQAAQSPVVIMMPAGWQPDGNYTFAPRTVLSPEVPAEHWPTSQRNPLGDDDRKGLFDWPQIAKKITNSTIGEPEIKPQAPAPEPSHSRALFASAAPAAPTVPPVQPQTVQPPQPAAQSEAAAPPSSPAAGAQPSSKALFAPQPEQPEPQPEQSKSRALFSLLSKPLSKPEAAPPSSGSKALFAFGRKKAEPAAPVPAVVPQYTAEAPLPPEHNMPSVTPTATVEAVDPEIQPPAPPSVANPLPGQLETVKSDNPRMKWRAKGAAAGVSPADSVARNETPPPQTVVVPASALESEHCNPPAATTAEPKPSHSAPIQPTTSPAGQSAAAHSPGAASAPVSNKRSLLGKHFPTMAGQTPRNASDQRDPWRRQAERDAAEAAEKEVERPVVTSKAILPNVAALLPAPEKPNRPVHTHDASQVATVAATEDAAVSARTVRRAHEPSARSTDSYYADPWEHEIETQLTALERRQVGATSNRRAAIAQQTSKRGEEQRGPQPRVPFETDELEQEKSLLRRTAHVPKSANTARTKSVAPAGSPSNGARLAEQRSQKNYRRLTGGDLKQGFVRPLEIFSNMTKLPSPLKAAADSVERRPDPEQDAYTAGDEVDGNERYDLRPQQPDPPKRSAAISQPAYELRQSTAPVARVSDLDEDESMTVAAEDSPAGLRGGRRHVQQSVRPGRVQHSSGDDSEADATAEDTGKAEVEVERPVQPAMHIRNKHGNQVKIFTGSAVAHDSQE